MTIYHVPENEQEMDEIYVVLSKDESGEGIVAMHTNHGLAPMVFGHKRMVEPTIVVAKKIAKETGKKLTVWKFKKSEMIEEINFQH